MSSKSGESPRVERASKDAKRSWSLASRLVAWYACSAFTLVLCATAFLYWGLAREFERGDDDVLLERVHVLRMLLRQGQAKHAELKWEVESEREELENPQIYLRILDEWQRPFLETPRMAQLLPVGVFPAAVGPEIPARGFRVRDPSGRAFRVLAATASGGEENVAWTIQAAFDLGTEETVLHKYRSLFVAVLIASALASLGFGYRITQSGMRPLAQIVDTTRRIRSPTLGERVRLEGLPAELATLADNFNDMLDRLEESFSRLSRFSSDIAHELRTPLSNLRGEAEVALSKARSGDEYREVLASSLEEYAHLSRIVDSLLFIALAERLGAAVEREQIDVIGELRAVAEFYEPIAAEKCLNIEVRSTGELWTELDRILFRRALSNLVSNAIAYTPNGGTISVTAAQQDSTLRVEVADTGIGVAPEHLPHVFDRFYRVERARRRISGGVGLGLSIVKTIMDLHEGSAEFLSEPGQGTRVTLIFPQIAKS